jgi:hypothetical protein
MAPHDLPPALAAAVDWLGGIGGCCGGVVCALGRRHERGQHACQRRAELPLYSRLEGREAGEMEREGEKWGGGAGRRRFSSGSAGRCERGGVGEEREG